MCQPDGQGGGAKKTHFTGKSISTVIFRCDFTVNIPRSFVLFFKTRDFFSDFLCQSTNSSVSLKNIYMFCLLLIYFSWMADLHVQSLTLKYGGREFNALKLKKTHDALQKHTKKHNHIQKCTENPDKTTLNRNALQFTTAQNIMKCAVGLGHACCC